MTLEEENAQLKIRIGEYIAEVRALRRHIEILKLFQDSYDDQMGNKALVESDSAREEALEIARRYGGIDGAHHKDWVIDQMVRALTGDAYKKFVEIACRGEEGRNRLTRGNGGTRGETA
jgi:hypothetical protein